MERNKHISVNIIYFHNYFIFFFVSFSSIFLLISYIIYMFRGFLCFMVFFVFLHIRWYLFCVSIVMTFSHFSIYYLLWSFCCIFIFSLCVCWKYFILNQKYQTIFEFVWWFKINLCYANYVFYFCFRFSFDFCP